MEIHLSPSRLYEHHTCTKCGRLVWIRKVEGDAEMPQKYFTVWEVAAAASCTKQWIRDLCKRVNFPIKPKYTAKEKDALVRLRWLYADAEKCVLYCWKNNVTP